LQTESSLKEEYLKFEVTSNQNEGTWRIGMPKKSKLNFRMRGNRVDAKLSMKHFFPTMPQIHDFDVMLFTASSSRFSLKQGLESTGHPFCRQNHHRQPSFAKHVISLSPSKRKIISVI